MSLMRLLCISQSMFSKDEMPCRYKLKVQPLPRFGLPKNEKENANAITVRTAGAGAIGRAA
jgi:hypothetical protein